MSLATTNDSPISKTFVPASTGLAEMENVRSWMTRHKRLTIFENVRSRINGTPIVREQHGNGRGTRIEPYRRASSTSSSRVATWGGKVLRGGWRTQACWYRRCFHDVSCAIQQRLVPNQPQVKEVAVHCWLLATAPEALMLGGVVNFLLSEGRRTKTGQV